MISLEDVRTHLQDFPEKNLRLNGQEFTDEEIQLALHLTLSDYNSIPPITSELPSRTPKILDSVLMSGVLAHLYKSKSLQYFKNQLDYSDGGIQVATHNKGPYYSQAAQAFQNEFDSKVSRIKAFMNLNNAYGELASDYLSTPDY